MVPSKIPFPKGYQSFEAEETNDESLPTGETPRDKSTPRSKSGTSHASLAATDINSHLQNFLLHARLTVEGH